MKELLKTVLFAIAISVAVVSVFCFSGCNTVKKATHLSKGRFDSVSLVSNTESKLSKSDSTNYHKQNNQWQREIIINYDTAGVLANVFDVDTSGVYVSKKYVHEPADVYKMSTRQRIKSVVIHETGSQLIEELTNVARIDSNDIAATMSVVKHTENEEKQVNKQSKRGTSLILSILVMLMVLYVFYRICQKWV